MLGRMNGLKNFNGYFFERATVNTSFEGLFSNMCRGACRRASPQDQM